LAGVPAVEPVVEPVGASRHRPALSADTFRDLLRQLTQRSPERLGQRRAAWTPRVAAVDLALALLLDLVTAGPLVHEHNTVSAWVLDQALVLPVALRRRHPSGVFAFLAVVACIQWAYGLPLAADAGLLLALYTVAEHEVRARAALAAVLLEIGVVWASFRFVPTGDGVLGSMIFLSGLVVAAYLLGTSLQTRRAYLAGLEDRARRLEIERDQQARLIQIAERTRIAREMHDIVSHNLSVMITLAAGAAATTPTDPQQAATAMEQVAATGRDALDEMRQLLGFLRDDEDGRDGGDTAPQPGLDQLDELLEQVRSTGLPVRFGVQGDPQPLPMSTQLTLYRTVQEALTNTRKHGRDVTKVTVLLSWQPTVLELAIADDGVSPEGVLDHGSGMGLVGMRERVAAAGGSVSAAPGPARGWRVLVRLPLIEGEPA
jgi:signal transduction histidine kinase